MTQGIAGDGGGLLEFCSEDRGQLVGVLGQWL